MNLVAVMGSPHGMQGNTGKLLGSFIQAAEAGGAQTTVFCLGDLDIAPCRGCDVCHRVGSCAIKDDFQTVLQAMLEADGIVLASPNYIFSVSAQMKALFDRCCGAVHLMALRGKYAAALVTSGGGGCDEVEQYILRFLRMTGCWTVGSTGAEAFRLADPQAAEQTVQAAADLGRELLEAADAKKQYADQEAELAAMAGFMEQLVTQQREHWTYEYEAWQARTAD